MRPGFIAICLLLVIPSSIVLVEAQESAAGTSPIQVRVALAESALVFDAGGREALAGSLLTQDIVGSPDAPVKNTRIVIKNRSPFIFNYVQGWATFYDERSVRCGEGLWKLEVLAPEELVEVDTPGLRLTCKPTTWRLVATTLLTRTIDVAKPSDTSLPPPADSVSTAPRPSPDASPALSGVPPLEINVNGKTIPIQLGNPLEFVVGKERVRIVVQPAP
jgi:hypothetical protein